MHRLKLTWLGNEGTIAKTTATFRICLSITLVYILIDNIVKFLAFRTLFKIIINENEYGDTVDIDSFYALVNWHRSLSFFFGIFIITLVAKLRNRIRSKYGIPEEQCAGCEDCCCSFWCNCCTVAQMARHTADYDTYAGLCCSETGMPPHAPSIV